MSTERNEGEKSATGIDEESAVRGEGSSVNSGGKRTRDDEGTEEGKVVKRSGRGRASFIDGVWEASDFVEVYGLFKFWKPNKLVPSRHSVRSNITKRSPSHSHFLDSVRVSAYPTITGTHGCIQPSGRPEGRKPMGDDQLAYFIFRGRDLESGETLSPYRHTIDMFTSIFEWKRVARLHRYRAALRRKAIKYNTPVEIADRLEQALLLLACCLGTLNGILHR